MAEETVEDSGNPPEIQTVQTLAETDWFLQSLVSMVNSSQLEIGITLNLGGFLVSGQLVGGKKYFVGFAETYSSAFPPGEDANSVRDNFSAFGNIYENEDGAVKDLGSPQYIHLRNARFFHTAGNAIPANAGVWWRGRLTEVSGFSLGHLSSD